MSESKRYLGLELAGAKNQKTSLAVLEHYPQQNKTFLLDVYDKITVEEHQSSDEALLELIEEVRPRIALMGVNVPLDLPPCTTCTRKTCPLPAHCSVPAVKWMREIGNKTSFTPYTQRPVELWIKHETLPQLPPESFFEIDETLGGNRAPLSARMVFLKRHLVDVPMIEVWPKLTLAALTQGLRISKRAFREYRLLDDGAYYRQEILTQLSEAYEIFIYERDLSKLSKNLAAFNAFICAFTSLLADQSRCVSPPKKFPASSGWVHYPL